MCKISYLLSLASICKKDNHFCYDCRSYDIVDVKNPHSTGFCHRLNIYHDGKIPICEELPISNKI